jgi:hypothetical protein
MQNHRATIGPSAGCHSIPAHNCPGSDELHGMMRRGQVRNRATNLSPALSSKGGLKVVAWISIEFFAQVIPARMARSSELNAATSHAAIGNQLSPPIQIVTGTPSKVVWAVSVIAATPDRGRRHHRLPALTLAAIPL